MFERYTEQARRALFFARHVASQVGSRTIETEHLLLGLTREAGSLISGFAPAVSIEDLRRQVRKNIEVREKVKASIQMPLSTECKHILSVAAEEADQLGDSFIGVEHLLLAMLREEKSLGARLLTDRGVRLESVRSELSRGQLVREDFHSPRRERQTLHALVDEVPENLLDRVRLALVRLISPSIVGRR